MHEEYFRSGYPFLSSLHFVHNSHEGVNLFRLVHHPGDIHFSSSAAAMDLR